MCVHVLYAVIFARAFASQNLAKISTSIYVYLIAKLSPREFPHLVQNRENICTGTRKLWHMAMRFELATRSVTSPDSENCAPLELQDSLTWKILALPYQMYTFSERKFHEEFKYGIQYDIGSGTKILWLKIFGFWRPQKRFFFLFFFARSIHLTPPLILIVILQHIWIPHEISFQEIYNYRILLFSKRKLKSAKICRFRKNQQ